MQESQGTLNRSMLSQTSVSSLSSTLKSRKSTKEVTKMISSKENQMVQINK